MILPTINLWGRFRFDKRDTNNETDGQTTKLTDTQVMPSVGISYINPFVLAGVSYEELDEKLESMGSSLTTIRQTRTAFLGFRPVELPTLDLQYIGQRRFDTSHTKLDQEDDIYTLRSMYQPVKSVQLYYNAEYDDTRYHLTLGETKTTLQTGRVNYDDRFFDNRLALNGSYSHSRQDVQSNRGNSGGGAILLQLFPVNGLSSISDTPTLNVLDVNQALIDGVLTASSGINIGQLPSLTGDIRQRNVGLDFGVPVQVSTLFVWVDRTLPALISNSFAWDIYTSQDNQNWSLYQTIFPAAFGLFDNRFEVTFPAVQTRYIKAVTRPLSVAVVPPPGVDVSNIFITEVQAFNAQTLAQTAGPTTTSVLTSDTLNFDGKMQIIRSDRHSLLYDLYYQNLESDQSGQPTSHQSTLANALIGVERFSKVFTGSAKIMVQNDENANGSTLTYYDYEASLVAMVQSLRKLHHSIVLTGKREEWDQIKATRESGILTLGNAGEVYPGINASLQLIESIVSAVTDTLSSRSDNTLVTFGADIIPHRSLTVNVNYDWSEGRQQGNGSTSPILGALTSRRTSTGANMAYNPFSSFYLFGSYQRIEETHQPTVTYTSFSGSWSAQQRGGALEFRLNYIENYEAQTQLRSRTYGPYVKWKINTRTYLDAAYTISTNDSPLQKNVAHTLNSSFKLYF